MRAVIQRVSRASVNIEGREKSSIDRGLLILLGIETQDTEADADWLCAKICQMRIFADPAGLMNLSLLDIGASILLISQFTLFASTKKGNRPSFLEAARPEQAIPLYEYMIAKMQQQTEGRVACGEFGADMQVALVNDGPVTILIDSKHRT